eukprot:scaffold2724_cov260-Pinguiococcus_pyrenoidosus.AAC.23
MWLLHHLELEVQRVNGHLVLAREGLERAGHEPLRKEEHGQRKGRWFAVDQPGMHEIYAVDEVLHPRAEALQGCKGNGAPQPGDGIHHESGVHPVQVQRHHNQAFDCLLQLNQRALHPADEAVELHHLLLQDDCQRRQQSVALDDKRSRSGRLVVKQIGSQLLEVRREIDHDLVAGFARVPSARPGLQVKDGLHQLQALLPVESRVGILVHPEHLGIVNAWQGVEVLQHSLQVRVLGSVVRAGVAESVRLMKHLRRHELAQDAHQAASIPVVGDPTTVVDLAGDERQGSPRNVVLLFKEAGAELAPLLYVRVEEGNAAQQSFECSRLAARLEVLLLDQVRKRLDHVGFDAVGRLVRHLHAVLEHGHREVACRRRREEQPEVVVDGARPARQVHDHGLHGRQPALGKHCVLEQDPVTCLASSSHEPLGNRALALAQRHKVNAVGIAALESKAEHHVRGIGTLRQDEDARRGLVQVVEYLLHARDRALLEALPELGAHEALNAVLQKILPEDLQQQQPHEQIELSLISTGLLSGTRLDAYPGLRGEQQVPGCLAYDVWAGIGRHAAPVHHARTTREELPLCLVDLARVSQDAEGEKRREQNLVLLEQAAADVRVHRVRGVVDDVLDPGRQHGGRLRLGLKVCQGVLVHRVHAAHVRDDEVQQRPPRGRRHVARPRFVDLHLRLLCLLHALLDNLRGGLRVVERVDENLVVEDVALGLGEQLEDLGLQILQKLLVLRHAQHEAHLAVLDVRPLLAHYHPQQLVFQAAQRDREVDQRHLDANLRQVVRIGVLRSHVQVEVRIVIHVGIAESDQDSIALLEGGSLQNGLERRLEILAHVLDQQRPADADAVLQRPQQVGIAHHGHGQLPIFVRLLDPLVRLPLWIDHERPALASSHQNSVVAADRVGGQVVVLPLADLHGIPESLGQRVLTARARQLTGDRVVDPAVHKRVAILARERAVVGHSGAGQEGISDERGFPPDALVGQPRRELVGALEARLRERRLLGKTLALAHRLVALLLQRGDLVRHLLQLVRLDLQVPIRVVQLRVELGHLLLLRLDLFGHGGVHVHRMHPHAHALRRAGHLGHVLHLELLSRDVLGADLLQDLRRDVVLVVAPQAVQKGRVVQEPLGGVPVGFGIQHDADGLHHDLDGHRRLGEGLDDADVILGEAVQGGDGALERRQRHVERSLGFGLDGRNFLRLLAHQGGLHGHLLLHEIGRRLVDGHLLQQLLGLFGLLLQHRLELGEVFFQTGDDSVRFFELGDADCHLLGLDVDGHLQLAQHRRVQADQVEEALGRGVHLAAELLKERDRHALDALVHDAAHLDERGAVGLLCELERPQEALGDGEERGLRPGHVPVDGCAGNERGEGPTAHTERVANGRHAQDGVQVVAYVQHEVLPGVVPRLRDAQLLEHRDHVSADLVLLVRCEEVGNLPGVQHVVNVLQHVLHHDLRVGEEEDNVFHRHAGNQHVLLDVLPKLVEAIPTRDLNLPAGHAGSERRYASEALLAAAPHADQHRVASRLPQDPRDAAGVRDGVLEEHEVDLIRELRVVLVGLVVQQIGDAGDARRFFVLPHICVGPEEVAKEGRGCEELLFGLGHPEMPPQELDDKALEPLLIVGVDETVVEDPLALVAPELHEALRRVAAGLGDHQNPLENLRDVAQLLRDPPKDLDRRRDHGRHRVSDACVKLAHRGEAREDAREDPGHDLRTGRRHAEHVEMPDEARRHLVPPALWWRRAGKKVGVLDVLPEELISVVEALEVQKLPQQLYRRLCTVFLHLGHVDVVHEDDDLSAGGCPQEVLAFLLQLALDGGLRHEGRRLRGEVDEHGHHAFATRPLALAENALAGARDAGDEDGLVDVNQMRDDVAEAHGVHRRDDHLEVGLVRLEFESRDDLVPFLEGSRPDIHEEVEDHAIGRDARVDGVVVKEAADEVVKGLPVLEVDGGTKAPHDGKEEDLLGQSLQLLERSTHGDAPLLGEERLEDVADAGDELYVHGLDGL